MSKRNHRFRNAKLPGDSTGTDEASDGFATSSFSDPNREGSDDVEEPLTGSSGTSSATLPAPTTAADVAKLDARQTNTIDAESLVWLPGAFRGFAGPEMYPTVRRIIGDSIRPKRERRDDDPPLPTMRCGAPMPGGMQCGRPIRPHLTKLKGQFHYVGAHCSQRATGHTAVFSRAIEPVILELLREEYSIERMSRAVDAVTIRSRSMRMRISAIDRELGATQQRLVTVGKQELDAAAAADAALEANTGGNQTANHSDLSISGNRVSPQEDAEVATATWRHYQRLRETLLREERTLLQERAALVAALEGVASDPGLPKQLAVVRNLAAHLPKLFRAASRHYGMMSGLTSILTRRISLRSIGANLAIVEVEFPNGALARRLVVTGTIKATQPHLAWAAAGLRNGHSAEDIADNWPETAASRSRQRRILPATVTSLALLYRYAPRSELRVGPAQTIESLAQSCRLTELDVQRAALGGHLGPAAVDSEGRFVLTPTLSEICSIAPDVARREMANRLGWAIEDTVDVKRLARAYGLELAKFLKSYGIPRSKLERGLDEHVYIHRDALPPTVRSGPDNSTLNRERADRYRAAVTKAVTSAGFDGGIAADFVPLVDVMAEFRQRTGFGAPATVTAARAAGTLLTVDYTGPSPHVDRPRPRVLVYCPVSVRSSSDVAVVRNWLSGILPGGVPLPERRKARSRSRRVGKGAKQSRS